jgi:hypothetical protein
MLTAHVDPSWARTAGVDVWNISTANADGREAVARWEELQEIRSELALLAEANRGVFARLIEGRESLAEAAEQLERTNRRRPGWPEQLRAEYPEATTDRDAHAQWAIGWVRNTLDDDPSRQAEVCARLEGEYQAMANRVSRGPSPRSSRSE